VRLEELQSSHCALTDALCGLRICHMKPARHQEAPADVLASAAPNAAKSHVGPAYHGRGESQLQATEQERDVGRQEPKGDNDRRQLCAPPEASSPYPSAGSELSQPERYRGMTPPSPPALWSQPPPPLAAREDDVSVGRKGSGATGAVAREMHRGAPPAMTEARTRGPGSSSPAVGGPAMVRAASMPTGLCRDPRSGGPGSGAARVVAAAHAKGFLLADLENFSEAEWEQFGATPSERSAVIGALKERRQRLEGSRCGVSKDYDRRSSAEGVGLPSSCVSDHLHDNLVSPDAAGLHGHARDRDLQEGLPCGIGHSKRHLGSRNHVFGGTAVGDGVGAHGHNRDDGPEGGGLPRGVGHGKRHHFREDHIRGGVGEGDPPGAHGHAKDDDLENGLERGIGHGRLHIVTPDHIKGGGTVPDDEVAERQGGRRHIGVADHLWGTTGDGRHETHGHTREDFGQGGMPCGIGSGKHHIAVKDHIEGGVAVADRPGSHGHSKDEDFEGGLQRAIGHGRRHLASGLDALALTGGLAAPAPPATVGRAVAWAFSGAAAPFDAVPAVAVPAGLPSRYSSPGEMGKASRPLGF